MSLCALHFMPLRMCLPAGRASGCYLVAGAAAAQGHCSVLRRLFAVDAAIRLRSTSKSVCVRCASSIFRSASKQDFHCALLVTPTQKTLVADQTLKWRL
jgi:hypothetical protein